MTRSPPAIIREIIAVLIFKALFLWGLWACCFNQEQTPKPDPIDFLTEVHHGSE